MIRGKCECGKISFEADDVISDFSHCHCSQCRRLHGAAFATFAGVLRDKFNYTSGTSDIQNYFSSPGSKRVFCGICGSNILVEVDTEPDVLYLAMGVVDGNPDHPPAYHQFVGSKAPWYEIRDDSPRYDEVIDD